MRKQPRTGFPSRTQPAEWPQACLDQEKKFSRQSARLFLMLGAPVWTPNGPGFLQQVFQDEARVLLDTEEVMNDKHKTLLMRSFMPSEIRPLTGVNYETLGITKTQISESETAHIRKHVAAAK